ncbi:MAG TPA: PAS domain S-box protein [Acidimicrobiales bacterium]|nr:PAS domain S-box protein [Acidimicrobiales bacterium]
MSSAATLERSAQMLCKADDAGLIVWCNESMGRALGPAALGDRATGPVGAGLADLVHRDDKMSVSAALDALRTGSDVSGLEVRLPDGEGRWRWYEWSARFEASRRVIYAAARDVTEDRENDEILRDDEVRLRGILEYSPASIFLKDLQGRYLIVNRQWSRVTGMPVDDVMGATSAECWPDDVALIAARERVLLETGVPLVTDDRLHTRAGVRHFRVARFLLLDDDGSPYAIGGLATDITDRTEAERALAGRERLLATVLQASPDIITLLDRDGAVQQVSAADHGVLGQKYGHVDKPDLLARVHPDDSDRVVDDFARMVAGTKPSVQTRFRVQHTEGHWVTLDTRGQAVFDDNGGFAGAVIVTRDMTVRIKSEQRLRDAREAAEQASRTKSEFLSRMSHELRTPLNSVLGFSQLLQMDELPEEQAGFVDHILRAGRHLLDLIDEVLDIARIESGHLELLMTAVAVTEIVNDAVELTRPMADGAEVSVRVVIGSGRDLLVHADRQRLLQVLLNLLSNAVKYNRPGGWVEVSCHEGAPGHLRLVVADNGHGIGAEDVDRVFTPFDRLGAELSGVEGTGVGLALSQHLVQRMGGGIGFESVVGMGSSFFVELAMATDAPDDLSDAPVRGWSGGIGGGDDTGAFRVLLMEDDVANLELVERVLARRPGIELLAAMQGSLGLELAREHKPDLILVDLHLPDMPGTAVLDRLSEDPATSAIPVAVVGGDAAVHGVRQLLGRGVVGFLTKPFDVRALLSLVDAVRSSRAAGGFPPGAGLL